MSRSQSTRSTKVKAEPDERINGKRAARKARAFQKVFFIAEEQLQDTTELQLERFYCAGKGRPALYMTRPERREIHEVLEFAEPRRSWLINSDVCSDGRVFITTPVDATFLAVHHLRKHCAHKAMALDSIHDEQDASAARLLTAFVRPEALAGVADVKCAGDMQFYKYNPEKCVAWLAVKTRRLAAVLRRSGVHCGHSALSQNYTRSDSAADESVQEVDYLRMACDIVGDSIDLDLYEELRRYLEIPAEALQPKADEKQAAAGGGKRKSLQTLNGGGTKKIKLEENGATDKLKTSSLLDESLDDGQSSPGDATPKATPLKDRTLTAKEKALAKGAKGTKSIASFFKK